MTRWLPYALGAVAAVGATVFALAVRLPMPFEGTASLAAAALAFLATLALGLALPARVLWSDAERLTHAFVTRHQMSEGRAVDALAAMTTAHRRADALRAEATAFAEALRQKTEAAADTLDEVAREIFYDPTSLQVYRANLVRADLIEETVSEHAQLRRRRASDANASQLELSRAQVDKALTAFQDAFAQSEERLANRILTRVTVSSDTAETLLAPRRAPTSETNNQENSP
ncbi:MAG: hypothetical protein AAGB05_03330 [Pseudomonadota bacterium]